MTPERFVHAVRRLVRRPRPWGGASPTVRMVLGPLAVGTALALSWPVIPATAQAACSFGGLSSGRVDITHPTWGSTVSGTVSVIGTAIASLPSSSYSHVDLLVDGTRVDTYDAAAARQLSFSLAWTAGPQSTGSRTLTVVACGSIGSHAEGAVTVNVAPQTATSRLGLPRPVAPTTSMPIATSTSVGSASTTTTVPRAVTTTRPDSPPPPDDNPPPQEPPPLPVEPAAGLPPGAGRLTLDQSGDRQSRHPALWVGAVVGLPGAAGVAVGALRRRQGVDRSMPPAFPPEEG